MLTQRKVERTTKAGRYRDRYGMSGLLLQVSAGGAKSWVLRYVLRGTERMLGLGSATVFSLKEARERARAARQLLADGIDPLVSKLAARAAAARHMTFAEAAAGYDRQHQAKWTSAAHAKEFMATLRKHVLPAIGDLDVAAIGTPELLRVLEPIWDSRSVTADRTRNRIEAVIDWAVVRGHRPPGPNPAKWKGHLDQVLPAARKVAPVKHHPAMAYRELPQFMAELRRVDTVPARALEFTIMVGARTSETIGAQWSEIDFDNATWTVPASRMKGRKEHRVPLAPTVLELLHALPREAGNPFVFVGVKPGAGMSDQPMARVLRGLRAGVVVHGFRSTLRDWAAEQTAYPREIAEMALAHVAGNAVERAYRRSDLVDKRRRLMDDWARFCTQPPAAGDVVSIRGRQ